MAISLIRGRCRLRELLAAKGMKQAEFARRMGVHRSTVTRWATEEKPMNFEVAVLAARILGFHAEDMFEWIEVPRDKIKRHME